MSWRGPSYDGEFPSLGWEILDWAEDTFRVPDGPLAGEPLRLTDEQATILVRWYGLDDRGRWLFRRGVVRRPQGWGKSPLLALIALAELAGPSRFDGWSADGEPVGVAPTAPWVQVAAVSEAQTDNTYSALYEMAKESDLNGSEIDVGLTRLFLVGEIGRLEPVTSAAGTRLGQRVTFAVLDETHLWTARNGGVKLAATLRRNAGKMAGRTFETTNAHEPGEDSVAERSWKAAQQGAAGLLYDSVEGDWVEDLSVRPAVLASLKKAYGDATWVDLERLADELADPGTIDGRRFYMNQLVGSSQRPVDIVAWENDLAVPDRIVEPGTRIGLGFDGSISDDSTVLYGCTADGFVFEIAVWNRPDTDRDRSWRVPRLDVDDAVHATFEQYDVGLMLCDPAKWWTEIETWVGRYGDERVVMLDTNQTRRFAPACDRFAVAAREQAVSHDGKSLLTAHLGACAKRKVRSRDDVDDGRTQFVIVKADTRKIDAAVAAVLAYEAAMTMPAADEPMTPLVDWI